MSDKDIKPTPQEEPVEEAKADAADADRKVERKSNTSRFKRHY